MVPELTRRCGHRTHSLTPKETQVLAALVAGEPVKAVQVGTLSTNTIATYAKRAYAKLHVTNRYDAVRKARRLRLI